MHGRDCLKTSIAKVMKTINKMVNIYQHFLDYQATIAGHTTESVACNRPVLCSYHYITLEHTFNKSLQEEFQRYPVKRSAHATLHRMDLSYVSADMKHNHLTSISITNPSQFCEIRLRAVYATGLDYDILSKLYHTYYR